MARRQDPLGLKKNKKRRAQEGTLLPNIQQIRFHDQTPTVALRGFVTDYPLDLSVLPVTPRPDDYYHVLPADPDQRDDLTLILKAHFIGDPKKP